jgi:spore maturation protein CgeB
MKILLVGDWSWPQYEEAFSVGLSREGVQVKSFATSALFQSLPGRIERNLCLLGPSALAFNLSLVKAVNSGNFDLVILWRVTELHPLTARLISGKVTLVSYNNDDPFGPKAHKLAPWHHRFLWRWYIKNLPFCHLNVFYREINRTESMSKGSRASEVLMPYFIPETDRPIALEPHELEVFQSDVVFVGHFEPDGRDHMLGALIEAGYNVKLWGSKGWQNSFSPIIRSNFPIVSPVRGDDYARAICGSRVSLAFLSKLNRDTYTRRCFEIPAMGGLLLAERTDDLMKIFKEDVEACFFSSQSELTEKVAWLIQNPVERDRIARAGNEKVWASGHHAVGRATEFLEMIKPLVGKTTGEN